MHLFWILLIFLAMLLMTMNCLTSTRSPNFMKHLTKIYCWFQKDVLQNLLTKILNCCEGEDSSILCHCTCQKWD
jgi:hypothetical protein